MLFVIITMAELWLKNNKVLTFVDKENFATSIKKIDTPELLPICLSKDCTVENFNFWLQKRAIPEEREGFSSLKQELEPLLGKDWQISLNKASLSDQYWIKYRFEEWKNINFFTKSYSSDIGDLIFKPWLSGKRKLDKNSPDLTTNGLLKKRWKQNQDFSSYLVKAGSKITQQEPLSEILVSVLLEQLKIIPFVRYDFYIEGVTMCSKCDNFITPDTEIVPASYIYRLEEKEPNEGVYHHLLKMCDRFEIEGAKDFIDGMIFIDSITGNADRNLGNIGFIRDINTLKIRTGPLFDFGAAYWSSGKIEERIRSNTFGDVEKRIFKRMKNKCDLEMALKSDGFKRCIETYPRLNLSKKQDLIKAINQRNKTLLAERDVELEI